MKEITREELKNLIEKNMQYILIDVRERNEIENYGVIPTSHNVPLSEFETAWDLSEEDFEKKYGFRVTRSDRIICYCRSGSRSAGATDFLSQKGYRAENYPGSVLDWSEIDPNVRAY